jgi:phage head maturation protease
MTRPVAGSLETRDLEITADGPRLRGRIPYGTQSADLGGWHEVIEPDALRSTNFDSLVLTVDHAGVPLARHPRTLDLEDRADGLHWSAEPPQSRADVVEAVARGDLAGGSWRMKVGRDEWRGDVRHIHSIAELRDVSIVTHPAYASAAVELRSQPEEEPPMPEVTERPVEATEERTAPEVESEAPRAPAGSLRVESRVSEERGRTLADCFRSNGFPGERAVISWSEFESRAITWSASVDAMSPVRRDGVPLGADQRYAWPAFGRVAVSPGDTSVVIVQQTARSLASPSSVIRPIDATTVKPETGSTVNIVTVSLKQVAAKQSGIPNLYLLQPAINTIIEQDLRLTINEGLDKLVLDAVATATQFQDPSGADLYTAARKAITTLEGHGYSPDTLILTPAAAEELDLFKATAGDSFYLSAPNFSSAQVFNLNKRISKAIPAPAVVDSTVFGKLYASPVSLARFEENFGQTNTSTIRMELNAIFGTERVDAAVRLAAS